MVVVSGKSKSPAYGRPSSVGPVSTGRALCSPMLMHSVIGAALALDGRADCVFWGRDEEPVAQALGAPRLDHAFGWLNLAIGHAEERVSTLRTRE